MFVSLDSPTSGTFYNYFDKKEAVFNVLNNEIGAELRQLLRDVRQRATSLDSFIKWSVSILEDDDVRAAQLARGRLVGACRHISELHRVED